MTPRMIQALRKRELEKMQREELLIGIIASTNANFSMGAPKKPLLAEAFMLHPLKKGQPMSVTGEEILSAFERFGARSINGN